jgi:hypothetical protein
VEFSRELGDDVLAGAITLSVRLWKRHRSKAGGRYGVIECAPFAAIAGADGPDDRLARVRPHGG